MDKAAKAAEKKAAKEAKDAEKAAAKAAKEAEKKRAKEAKDAEKAAAKAAKEAKKKGGDGFNPNFAQPESRAPRPSNAPPPEPAGDRATGTAAAEQAAAEKAAAEKAAAEKAAAEKAAAEKAAAEKAAAEKAAEEAEAERVAKEKAKAEQDAWEAEKAAANAAAEKEKEAVAAQSTSQDIAPPSAVKRRESKGFTRTSSARRSTHGAPQATVPGVVTVKESKPSPLAEEGLSEPEDAVLGAEIVEDAADEGVGAMKSDDATRTANFLSETVNAIRQKMTVMYDNGTNRGYSQAYGALARIGGNNTSNAFFRENNKLKNRYGNITAYDHSRVLLPIEHDDPDSDYINANWISGYGRDKVYIASQGPVPNSFISFWRMVWHTQVETIVMVTHEVEGGRMKCHRYWPDPTSSPPVKTLQYGRVMVSHVSTVPHKHFVVRTFSVELDGASRTVKQFAYTSWPDHGVPLTTTELLGFRNAVDSGRNKEVPLLVHCSAGVGRTGTYIGIDYLVEKSLNMGGDIVQSVDKFIGVMREARNFMVQTEVQYIFIWRATLDCISYLLSGESEKAIKMEMAKAEQEALKLAADAAAAEQKARQEEEDAANDGARMELLARESNTAAGAAAVVKMSIKERLELLAGAEERWMKAYKASMEEWNERNKFEAEVYDLSFALTPIQSRLEALRQKGLDQE